MKRISFLGVAAVMVISAAFTSCAKDVYKGGLEVSKPKEELVETSKTDTFTLTVKHATTDQTIGTLGIKILPLQPNNVTMIVTEKEKIDE